MLFFWFFKNCELIRDSSLWRSNFILLVRDSIIIIGSRCYTYTFGSHFDYKHWVRVSIKNLNFSFLGQLFQYCLLGLKMCRLRFTSISHPHAKKKKLKSYTIIHFTISLREKITLIFVLEIAKICKNKK